LVNKILGCYFVVEISFFTLVQYITHSVRQPDGVCRIMLTNGIVCGLLKSAWL